MDENHDDGGNHEDGHNNDQECDSFELKKGIKKRQKTNRRKKVGGVIKSFHL